MQLVPLFLLLFEQCVSLVSYVAGDGVKLLRAGLVDVVRLFQSADFMLLRHQSLLLTRDCARRRPEWPSGRKFWE